MRVPSDFQAGPDRLPPRWFHKNTSELFPYQQIAVEKLAEWHRNPCARGILCLPTGAGKTRTAVDFILANVVEENACVVWLTHRDELITQTVRTFAERAHLAPFCLRIGTYGGTRATRTEKRCHVLVASVSTLARGGHLEWIKKHQRAIKLVVVDECHHAPAPTWTGVIEKLAPLKSETRLLGLSATATSARDERTRQLWSIFQTLVHEERAIDLMKAPGYLATPRLILASGSHFDATEAEARRALELGDLPYSLVLRISRDHFRNAVIARTYLDAPEKWGKTLIFAGRIEQAKTLHEMLSGGDRNVGVIFGSGPQAQEARADALVNFRRPGPAVLINVDILTEGTDLPDVETVFIARPTRSHVLFQQMIGRGLRGPAVKGTAHCNIVAFNDDIRGLTGEFLTGDHSWMAEHYAMLGFEGVQPNPGAIEAPQPSPARLGVRGVFERAFARYATAFHALGLSVVLDRTKLLGWWTASAAKATNASARRYVLPHFSGDNRFVLGMRECLSTSPLQCPPALRYASAWVSWQLIDQFFQHAQDERLTVTYQAIAKGTPDDLEGFFDDVALWELPPVPVRYGDERKFIEMNRLVRIENSFVESLLERLRKTDEGRDGEVEFSEEVRQAWEEATPILNRQSIQGRRDRLRERIAEATRVVRRQAAAKEAAAATLAERERWQQLVEEAATRRARFLAPLLPPRRRQ